MATDIPMYSVQSVRGKGKGLVATRRIPEGTRILSEEPIIRLSGKELDDERLQKSIFRQVHALDDRQRQTFLSLHNIYPYRNDAERYVGIFRTTALPFGDEKDGGVFLEACYINHACDNNAQKDWNENIKRHTVHALRDISEGEEITIYYLSSHRNRAARQESLRSKFNFRCECRLCSLPPELSQESDKRLDNIFKLDSLIGQSGIEGILSHPLRTLRLVDRQIQLYNEHGPGDIGLSRAFFDAAQISICHGDLARGQTFGQRAVSRWRILLGDDSPNVVDHMRFAEDPSKHPLYGMSMVWRTAVNEIPCNLESEDFENWLWKREKPQRLGQSVNLRSRTYFPVFIDLPGDNTIYGSFDEIDAMIGAKPLQNWCFLAEIVDFTMLLRLQMTVKDVDERQVPLFFYTDGRGSELVPENIRKGYTVAILYAQRHSFMFDEPGIRLEDIRTFKIFPISLLDLLLLNDRIQQSSTDSSGVKTCHGCAKQATALKPCSKCLLFWYCNTSCQAIGWNDNGHKADCKLLKDRDLRGLFLHRWADSTARIRFPLR